MSDAAASPVAEGEVIAGKYRVSRTLGTGGMGVVVAATHVELGHRVALKFLLPQATNYPDLIERFAREARAAAQIQSEHVARVTDVGTLTTGAPYMVMEYLEGQDLDEVLTLSGRLDVQTAVGHVLQACEALAEAHAMGIVHRDLKPANLFLANRPDGTSVVKVIDFGISKAMMTANETGITATSAMVGSPAYMAPEQIKAARFVDARADQWSLGVTLYELLTGQKPFNAFTMAELVWVILDHPHAPIATLRDDIPPGLAAIIDRCLNKEPSKRFGDLAELALDLAPYGPDWGRHSAASSAHLLGVTFGLRATEIASLEPQAPIARPIEAVAPAIAVTPTLVNGTGPSLEAPEAPVAPRSAAPVESGVTASPWSSQSSPNLAALAGTSSRPRRRLLMTVGAAAIVGVAIIGGLLSSRATPMAVVVVAPSATAVMAASVAPEAPRPPSPTPPVETSAGARPVAPTASSSSAPTHAAPSTPPQPRVAMPSKAVVPSAAASGRCSTVSYFDGDGMKHFKQDCH